MFKYLGHPLALAAGFSALFTYSTGWYLERYSFNPVTALVLSVVPYAGAAALRAYTDWFEQVTRERRERLVDLPRFSNMV
jgi:hypothetical protein